MHRHCKSHWHTKKLNFSFCSQAKTFYWHGFKRKLQTQWLNDKTLPTSRHSLEHHTYHDSKTNALLIFAFLKNEGEKKKRKKEKILADGGNPLFFTCCFLAACSEFFGYKIWNFENDLIIKFKWTEQNF